MTAKGAPAGGNAHGEAHTPVVLVALWMGCDFGRDALAGITDEIAAQALPWRLKFVNSDRTFASAMEWLNSTGRLSGVISCYEDIKGAAARAVSAGRFPAVWLSRERQPSTRTAADNTSVTGGRRHRARRAREAFVALDTAAVVGEAVRHFRERTGFRSFGFVDSRRDEGWSRLRGDKCLAELRRLGLRGERFRASSDLAEMAGFLRSMERPAAVLAANDATAADVIEVCIESGIAVPREVAVLGMDDDQAYCQLSAPNISSIRFNGREAGRICVRALASLMGGAPPPDGPLLYGVEAVSQRASTGAVSTAGALVQKALDYIDANACRGASAADVVRHLGVSRSLAALRFHELRGESLSEAIEARRVAEARRLLAKNDMPLDEIAARCGYSAAGALRRVFLATTGETPGAFRARQDRP